MDQPVATVTLTRPWGWGGASLHDADYEYPQGEGDPVADDDRRIDLGLRHAADIEFDGQDPAPLTESTITFTSWETEPTIERPGRVLLDTVVPTPSELLSIGDPEYTIFLPTAQPSTRVRVNGEGASWGDDKIWVDLWPAG